MPGISVVIPSRLERSPSGALFLESALASIRAQGAAADTAIQILVGVDAGARIPSELAATPGVRFVESDGASQAEAVNAAARLIEHDHIAFLEDDDRWNPAFLDLTSRLLADFDFVSSTQLEVDPAGEILRINDFPTPSGWVMRRALWEQVGPFNPDFRWHLDNEWLGRLGESGARRAHLMEATAPVQMPMIQAVRPWLENLLAMAKPPVRLVRHNSPWPLVVRLMHPASGMGRIALNPELGAQAQKEMDILAERFGRLPW